MSQGQSLREHQRVRTDCSLTLTWQNQSGKTRSVESRALNLSKSGILVSCHEPIPVGSLLYVQDAKNSIHGQAHIRRCVQRAAGYDLGLQFSEETAATIQVAATRPRDYYEVLQISRHADQETIERVFRIMAMRFHPDNRETGDHERFVLLREAYTVLCDPVARAQYDATYETDEQGPLPIFELRDFVDDVPGELNRRLGVLCLLYNKRRRDQDHPGLSLLQLEQLMSFPREYLTFTLWFLYERAYIRMTDSSDYVLTASGAEYVERKVPSDRLAVALLRQGAGESMAQRMADVPLDPAHLVEDGPLGEGLSEDGLGTFRTN